VEGRIKRGFFPHRGNSQTTNLALGFLGTRQTLNDKLGVYANSVYATNNAVGAVPSTTANTAAGGFRYDHDLTPRVFGFGAADFYADALQGLNLRSVFGGGAGYHAIKKDTTTLDFLGGLNYTHESYTTLSRNLIALTLGRRTDAQTRKEHHSKPAPDLLSRHQQRRRFSRHLRFRHGHKDE
jgi:putative salt-induced outer membrane protein YdiY